MSSVFGELSGGDGDMIRNGCSLLNPLGAGRVASHGGVCYVLSMDEGKVVIDLHNGGDSLTFSLLDKRGHRVVQRTLNYDQVSVRVDLVYSNCTIWELMGVCVNT
jgi:hypothetical protein